VIAGLWFGPALAFEDQAADGWPGWQAVSQVELDATRAKGHIFDFDATLTGNTITVSGDATNTIDDHAFTHFSGLANVIQNNGNGAIIQAGIAVTVNVYSGPAPD
jgi:hypothetical protein